MSMPSKSQIVKYWAADDRIYKETGVYIEWSKPICWACSFGWNGRYDVRNANSTWVDYLRAWEKAPLQRCHIIPRSIDGCDTPSNLFLMCAECHDLAPDINDKEIFFWWVESQNYIRRRREKLQQAFKDFGIDTNDDVLMEEFKKILDSEDFKSWCDRNIGLHARQRPPYGVGYSESTRVAAVLSYYRKQKDHL